MNNYVYVVLRGMDFISVFADRDDAIAWVESLGVVHDPDWSDVECWGGRATKDFRRWDIDDIIMVDPKPLR